MKTHTLFILAITMALLLGACGSATPTPAAPAQSGVSVDVTGVAQSSSSEVIAAVPASDAVQGWQVLPEYTRLSLQGYPVSKHVLTPQIFVYPVSGLANNQYTQVVTQALRTLLQNQQVGDSLPFMPLESVISSKQMIDAQVKYVDFKNGKGVRFITQYANGIVPVNNRELIYTFQGLTSDGKYYVAVVMPLNMTGLPADDQDRSNLPASFSSDYVSYLGEIQAKINQVPAGDFTPDLDALDAMVKSIEVK